MHNEVKFPPIQVGPHSMSEAVGRFAAWARNRRRVVITGALRAIVISPAATGNALAPSFHSAAVGQLSA